MIEFPTDVSKIAVVGDLHRNLKYALKCIKKAKLADVQVIVQVGDFGYDFQGGFLKVLEVELAKADIILMFIDGNHEDFNWLYDREVSEDDVRRLREHIWHLPRNFRWQWQGVKFHALGGAHSVDRQQRTPMVSWWPQEHLTQVDYAVALESPEADVMITHDAPTQAPVPLGDASWIPAVDLHSAALHRTLLRDVVEVIKPKHLFHGHYHVRYEGKVDGTQYHGLGCDNMMFDRSMMIVDVLDLL